MTETAFKEAVSLRQAGETELIKLKEAVKNPLMKHKIRGKCKARIIFLEKKLGLLEKLFIPGFLGGNNTCKK